jgi:hypothetical protein
MSRGASGHLERLPSGSFRVHVYAGIDPLTGRELRHRRTVKTAQQAQILLGKLLEQAAEGRQPETGVTVAELLRQYMTVAELDRSTRQTYEGYIRRTILPIFDLELCWALIILMHRCVVEDQVESMVAEVGKACRLQDHLVDRQQVEER